jgi:hypothetical protein
MCWTLADVRRLAHALDWTLKHVPGAVMAIQGKGSAPTDSDILAALDYGRGDSSPAAPAQRHEGHRGESSVERLADQAMEITDALALAPWPSIVATVAGMGEAYAKQLEMYFEYAARYGLPQTRDGSGAYNAKLAEKYGIGRATVTRRLKIVPEIIAQLALAGIYTPRTQ